MVQSYTQGQESQLRLCQKASKRGRSVARNNLWSDKNKINLYQNTGKRKVWWKKGMLTTSNTVGSLVFIDNMTAPKSSQVKSVQIQHNAANLIGQRFTVKWIMTQSILQKCPKSFSRQRNCSVAKSVTWSQPNRGCFSVSEDRERPTNSNNAAVCSNPRKETQNLVMSVDSRPQLASKNVCNSKTANVILFLNPYELKLEVCSLLWGCTEENYKQKNLTYYPKMYGPNS